MIVVHDGSKRSEPTVAMFKGSSLDFPPPPRVSADVMKEFK